MKDIESRKDIEQLIQTFYGIVTKDDLIGVVFNEVVTIDWEKHLPVMYDFWDSIIFSAGNYAGNPMALHKHLHSIWPLNEAHFERWLKIFNETVDALFSGEKAELAKARAKGIAAIMLVKINSPGNIA
jgi:hemoglobin